MYPNIFINLNSDVLEKHQKDEGEYTDGLKADKEKSELRSTRMYTIFLIASILFGMYSMYSSNKTAKIAVSSEFNKFIVEQTQNDLNSLSQIINSLQNVDIEIDFKNIYNLLSEWSLSRAKKEIRAY